MKKKSLITGFILTSICSLYAQHYQTVKSDRIAYFNNLNQDVKCIRIDSTKMNKDSIFYPFCNIQRLDYNCYSPTSYSWIGKKVIIQSNGDNIFINKMNDSVKIKTNAVLNESWIAYKYKDSSVILAKIEKWDTLGFLGLSDSVKTIKFGVYDKKMNPISSIVNDISIILSKNYGFVKLLNFSLFPNSGYDVIAGNLEAYNLIGLTKPRIGIQNLTWLEVFDFQIGDELHTLHYNDKGFGSSITKKLKIKYLDKKIFKDSVVYQVEREMRTDNKEINSDNATSILHDTITERYGPNSSFDKLPGEPIISQGEAYSYTMSYQDNVLKTEPSIYNTILKPLSNDSCWRLPIADGCFPSYSYIKGLGGPYFSCVNGILGSEYNKLVYYKKGIKIWGTPLVITNIENKVTDENTHVGPNPTADFIFIKSKVDSPINFELSDLQGRVVINNIQISSDYNIDISFLQEGIYIYRLKTNDTIIKVGKITKTANYR